MIASRIPMIFMRLIRRKELPIIEVLSNNIVSGQFNTHGIAIEKGKDPCPVVCNSIPQYLNK